jgi:Flp pilus assembly protein TadD
MTGLKEILASRPDDRDMLLAHVSFECDAGDFATALQYAEQLARIAPGDPNLANLVESLRRQIEKPDAR